MRDNIQRESYFFPSQFFYVEPQQWRDEQKSRITQRVDFCREMIEDHSGKKNMCDAERKGND